MDANPPAPVPRRGEPKIFEEAGEYVEWDDVAELYDLLDVVQALIDLEDPGLEAHEAHQAKVAQHGGFTRFAEWCPVPPKHTCPRCTGQAVTAAHMRRWADGDDTHPGEGEEGKAVAVERRRLVTLVRATCACQRCKDDIASLMTAEDPGSER